MININPNASFWSAIVKSNSKLVLEIPDSCYISITNVCIPKLPNDLQSPIRLFAHVKTISESSLKNVNETFKTTHSDALVASLIPEKREYQHLNILFSPLNTVELEVKGGSDVHIAGILMPINAMVEEEEEEEEFNE